MHGLAMWRMGVLMYRGVGVFGAGSMGKGQCIVRYLAGALKGV